MVNTVKISFFALLFAFSGCCSEPLEPLTPVVTGNPMRVVESGSFVDQSDPTIEVIFIQFNQEQNDQTINNSSVIVEGMDGVSIKTSPNNLEIRGTPNCGAEQCLVKLTLKGIGDQAITNTVGSPLDGDDDKIDGGDFVQTFLF